MLSSQRNQPNLSSSIQYRLKSLVEVAQKLVKSIPKSWLKIVMNLPLIRSKSSQEALQVRLQVQNKHLGLRTKKQSFLKLTIKKNP